MTGQIPHHDEHLWLNDETTADDVRRFTRSRLQEPARIGDVIVFNFSNHDIDANALVNAQLPGGVYVVPFNVAGVWPAVLNLLPAELQAAPVLTYKDDTYAAFESFYEATDGGDDRFRDVYEAAIGEIAHP